MKILVKIVFVIIIFLISYGYYTKTANDIKGNALIGVGILSIVFILMPLFLIDRYRNKKLKSFIYKHEEKSQD